jgi:hypothetical protein
MKTNAKRLRVARETIKHLDLTSLQLAAAGWSDAINASIVFGVQLNPGAQGSGGQTGVRAPITSQPPPQTSIT